MSFAFPCPRHPQFEFASASREGERLYRAPLCTGSKRSLQQVAEAGVFMLHYVLLASFVFSRGSESGPTMHPLLGIVNIVNAGGY